MHPPYRSRSRSTSARWCFRTTSRSLRGTRSSGRRLSHHALALIGEGSL
jgi:hypothetical protein